MFPFDTNLPALLIGLLASLGFVAEGSISRSEYKAGREEIEASYQMAMENCDPLADNRRDICIAEAQGAKNVAHAALEARYRPSSDAAYNIYVAKAEAAYALARARCDNQAGAARDACANKASADAAEAKAEARARLASVGGDVPRATR